RDEGAAARLERSGALPERGGDPHAVWRAQESAAHRRGLRQPLRRGVLPQQALSMRFGCSFWLDRDPRQAARLARVAEDAGFQDVWFPDHYFIREVYAALALAATATRRIGLGTGVTSPHLRHLVLLASAVATLDELSE